MFEFLGIYFARIDRIVYAPIFLVIIFLIIKNYFEIRNSIVLLVNERNKNKILKNFSLKRLWAKAFFRIIATFAIFISIMQPQWGKKDIKVVQEGRDLLIAFDVSRSMLAQDLKPSRLEFAKLKIKKLLSKLDFERVGLILFSGSAFVQCPLTADHNSFIMFLDQVDAETIASGTTAIDSAISKAVSVFSAVKNRKNKLVLLVTDGEDFSTNLSGIKQKAKNENIKLFTFGVGTDKGAPIPILNKFGKQIGHETESSGAIALSKLNENGLRDISSELSGSYIKISYDDSDINKLVKIIKSFEKEKFEDRQFSLFEDQYPWFIGVAWIMLLLEWVI